MDWGVSLDVGGGLLIVSALGLLGELDIGAGDLLQLADARAALANDAPDLRHRDGQLHCQPHVVAAASPRKTGSYVRQYIVLALLTELKGSLNLGNASVFVLLIHRPMRTKISCKKTQTLPNLRLPISSGNYLEVYQSVLL